MSDFKTKNYVNRGWVELYTDFGIDPSTQLLVHNPNSNFLFISTEDPDLGNYYRVNAKETAIVSYLADEVWVKCDGNISVAEHLTSKVSEAKVVTLPNDLFTSDDPKYRRLRVDMAQTGFYEGREFRAYREFEIPVGETWCLKVEVQEDMILWNIEIELDQSGLRFRTLVDDGSIVETTPFSNPLPIIPKNNMTKAPSVTPLTTITNGGQISGGMEIDRHRIFASGRPSVKTTVGGQVGDERGVAPGVYYLELENIDNNLVAMGVISSWWEEDPFT